MYSRCGLVLLLWLLGGQASALPALPEWLSARFELQTSRVPACPREGADGVRLNLEKGQLRGYADSLRFDLGCARGGGTGSEGEQQALSLLLTLPPIEFETDMLTLYLPQGTRVQGAARLRHLARRIELEWLTEPGELRLLLEPRGEGWHWSGEIPAGSLHPALSGALTLSGEWQPGSPASMRIDGRLPAPTRGDWQLALQASQDKQGWQILPASRLTIPRLRWQGLDIADLRIRPRSALSTRQPLQLELNWKQAHWQGSPLPLQAIRLELAGLDNHQGKIRARLAEQLELAGQWRYRSEKLALTVPKQTFSLPVAWSWLAGWQTMPAGLVPAAGKLALSLSAPDLLNSHLPIRLNMTLENGDIGYRDIAAEGVTGRLDLGWSRAGWHSPGVNSLSIKRINPGVELSDIYAVFRLEQGRPWLSGLTARLLGGRLALSPMALGRDLGGELHVSDLSLARLLSLVAVTGLSGEGRLHGRLPFRYRQGLSVVNGRIHSRDGWLSYQADSELQARAEDNLSLALTLGMLKDLRYQRLEADVSMSPTGAAVIDSRLEGHAPVMGKVHPVNLNYHHEENLLELLTSLRFAQDISERLPSRMRGENK